jgi:hypothetical protein
MKKIWFALIVFFFAGCLQMQGTVSFDKSEFYEEKIGEETYYFRYPQGAELNEDSGSMMYESCEVNFGIGLSPIFHENLVLKERTNGDFSYEAWYYDGLLVVYSGEMKSVDFAFVVSDFDEGVSQCVDLVNKLTESFTDKPIYYNEKFGFKVDLLADYKVEPLPSGEGVLMEKWIEQEDCEDEEKEIDENCGNYKVEIYVMGQDNVMEYENLADFVRKKYEGYSVEFVDHEGMPGICVDEGSGEDALRHFFIMDEDASVIYEAYLKVPSFYYSKHRSEFDEFVKGIEVF